MNKRINLLIIISLFFLTGCSQEKQTKGIYINSDSQLQTELLKKNSSPFLPDRIENLKNLTRNYSKDYKNNYSEIKILLHKLNLSLIHI